MALVDLQDHGCGGGLTAAGQPAVGGGRPATGGQSYPALERIHRRGVACLADHGEAHAGQVSSAGRPALVVEAVATAAAVAAAVATGLSSLCSTYSRAAAGRELREPAGSKAEVVALSTEGGKFAGVAE